MPLNKALRAQWLAAGYFEIEKGARVCRMGSAEVCTPPPAHLIRAYHLTSAQHAVTALALRRLKVARLADLNDPFEFMWVMWRHLDLRRKIQEWKDQYDELLGFLCFSSDWTNPVLWSHYADKHRGICLGFDLVRAEAKFVSYEANRQDIQLPGQVGRLSPELEDRLLLTKFAHWRYESEIRLRVPLDRTSPEGPLHFTAFSESLVLKEVILGDQCPLSTEVVRGLTSAMDSKPITFRARLAGKSYNVVPDGESVL